MFVDTHDTLDTLAPQVARTILVVDDLPDARDVLARLLRLEGHRSVTADDGESALEAVESVHPDLVLLDVTMPGMDGLDVLRKLREDPRHGDLPVVMFSAAGDPRSAAEALRLGACDYVIKGTLPTDDLLARIARHLPPS